MWMLAFISAIYTVNYQFMDVYIMPRWLYFGMLYTILFVLCSIYKLRRYKIDHVKEYLYLGIFIISAIESARGIYTYIICRTPIDGCFDNVAGYSSMQCIGVPFILHFYSHTSSKIARILVWGSILLILCSLVLSGSRAGVLVSLTIIMLFGIISSTPRKRRFLLYSWAILLLVGILVCLSVKTDSTDGRIFILNRSWEMVKEKPLLGFGYGGFRLHYMDFQANHFASSYDNQHSILADNIRHPLNEYVKIIIEYGIVGFLCIIFGTLLLYWSINKKYNVIDSPMLLSLLSVALLSLFSYPMQYPHTWLILTLPFFFAYIKSSNINRIYHQGILVTSIIVFSFLSVRVHKELEWGYIYHNQELLGKKDLLLRYEELYTYFKSNPYFLYNYAHILYRNQEYKYALLVANKCNKYWHDYELEILRGDIYDSIGDKDYAIYAFINASHMCPNRFMPLHKLFRMALKQKEYDLARFYAEVILAKPIKVDSYEVQYIINECYNYYHHKL